MITPPTIFFNNSYEYKHLPTRQLWLNLSVHFTSIPFGIYINCALWLWPVVHCSAHIEQLIYTALNIEWWASTHMFCGYIERDIPYHVRSKFAGGLHCCYVNKMHKEKEETNERKKWNGRRLSIFFIRSFHVCQVFIFVISLTPPHLCIVPFCGGKGNSCSYFSLTMHCQHFIRQTKAFTASENIMVVIRECVCVCAFRFQQRSRLQFLLQARIATRKSHMGFCHRVISSQCRNFFTYPCSS